MMADSKDRSMAPRMVHSRAFLMDCLKVQYLAMLMGAEMVHSRVFLKDYLKVQYLAKLMVAETGRRTAAEMVQPMAFEKENSKVHWHNSCTDLW